MAGCPGTVLNGLRSVLEKAHYLPHHRAGMWQISPDADGRVVALHQVGDGIGAVGCGADRPREYSHEDLASHRDRRPERAGLAGGFRPGQGSTSGATAAAVQPRSRRAGPGAASSAPGGPLGASSSGDARRTCAGDAFDTVGRARRAARGRHAARRDAGFIAVGPGGRCLGTQPRRRTWCGAVVGARCCDVGIAIRREGNASNRFSNGHDAHGNASE